MNEQQKEIFNAITDIVENLNDNNLKHIINQTVSFPAKEQKLNMILIGQPYHALFDMAYRLLAANVPVIGKISKSYIAKIKYGEMVSYKVKSFQDEYTEISIEELGNVLNSDFANKYAEIEITINSPVLENIDLQLVCSAESYEDFFWQRLLSEADFCVMTMSAIQLLSISERHFIKNTLYLYLGSGRYGIYIHDFGKLLDDEGKKDVIEAVKYFFKDNSAISIFYSPDKETELCPEFIEFTQNEFAKNKDVYRNLTIKQDLLVCIHEIKTAVQKMKDGFTIDMDKFETAIEQLNIATISLESKKKLTKLHIGTYISANVKIPFIEKLTAFNEALKKDIHGNLAENNNFEKMQISLSKYVEHSWKEFFEVQQCGISIQIQHEMLEIGDTIQKEITDLITSSMDEESGMLLIESVLSGLKGGISARNIKSKHWAAEISKYMSIGGIAMIFFAGIPLALLTIGGSQALKFIFKDKIETDRREKFINSVYIQCDEILNKVIMQTEQQFSSIVSDLQNATDNAYKNTFEKMLSVLEDRKQEVQNSEKIQAYLNDVLGNVIPQLENRLTRI